MATHDYIISNASGASVRADLNNALAAIVSNNSNATSPATTYAYQWWADTTTGQLKLRNSDNDGWITLRELDGTLLMEEGSVSAPGLAFAVDLDTGFFRSAADKLNIATGGAERLEIGSSEVVFNDPSNDVDFRVESNGNTHMLFVEGGTDRVGIGESDPDQTLHISEAASGTTMGVIIHNTATANDSDARLTFNTNSGGAEKTRAYIQATGNTSAAGNLIFATRKSGSTNESARIDSNGRLLVGSSSSQGSGRKLQVADTSAEAGIEVFRYVTSATSAPVLNFSKSKSATLNTNTAVVDDDFLGYIQFKGANGSGYNVAAQITSEVDGTPGVDDMPGRLVFSTTADGASSPTERLRLDSAGRLMLGTSTTRAGGFAIAKGYSSSSPAVPAAGTSTSSLLVGNDDGGSYGLAMGANGSGNGFIQAQRSDGNTTVYNLFLQPNGGNIGIGTTTPDVKLDVVGTSGSSTVAEFTYSAAASVFLKLANSSNALGYIGYETTDLTFYTNNLQRSKIDGDGRLLVGTSSNKNSNAYIQNYRASGHSVIHTQSDALDNGHICVFSSQYKKTGGTYQYVEIGAYNHSGITNPTGYLRLPNIDLETYFMWNDSDGNFRTSDNGDHIGTQNGTVVGTQTSDSRLKNVGANVGYGLAEVKQLQPKQYALKKSPNVNRLGFIAQEVESIIPEAVFDTNQELPGHQEGDRTKLGMEYVQLIPVLVNAIKELSAEVDTLKTKVAALEAG